MMIALPLTYYNSLTGVTITNVVMIMNTIL